MEKKNTLPTETEIKQCNAKQRVKMGDLSQYKESIYKQIIDNCVEVNSKQELIKEVTAILDKLPEFEKGMLQINGVLSIGVSPFKHN